MWVQWEAFTFTAKFFMLWTPWQGFESNTERVVSSADSGPTDWSLNILSKFPSGDAVNNVPIWDCQITHYLLLPT